ncbi:MAG: hypothetical protein Q9194_001785 [Teloschistes cf. exilis]
MLHREASPILYSNNRFQFPEIYPKVWGRQSAYISPFLKQIGSNATLIRHICIPSPVIYVASSDRGTFRPLQLRNLGRIRKTCTLIQTLEFLGEADDWELILEGCTKAVKVFDSINKIFRTIPSLEKIIINFEMEHNEGVGEDLEEMIRGYGWTLQLTEVPTEVSFFTIDICKTMRA